MALPLAFIGFPLYVHVPVLYVSYFDISLTSVGSVLLAVRLFDAIQDPFIGHMSDDMHSIRKKIILLGIGLLMGGFWMVFHPMDDYPLLWLAISMVLCTTGTLLGAHEQHKEDVLFAYHVMGVMYIPLLTLAAVSLFSWMKKTRLGSPPLSRDTPPFSTLVTPWTTRFFTLYLCNACASAIPAVLVLFFINDRLQAPHATGLFLTLYFMSGAAAMPIWQYVARHIGKEKAWVSSMILACMTFIWAYRLGAGDETAYAMICILSGAALGADLALPPSILADRIADKQEHDAASRYFAITTFLSKAALALATGVTLPLLDILGYQPGVIHDEASLDSLSFLYAFVPSCLKLLVALWLTYFIHNTHVRTIP
ncbi:MAG: MFS transporter [Alphaproteobacteria bacterium GM7ARS4]|nr:MFS transporter [Alphaproteobacteria bacterium GM7ARS4]